MKAMLLAAGYGTRLQEITATLPKPLIEVHGRPLIYYPLSVLKKAGIRDVIINVHHHGDKIKNVLGDGRSLDMIIHYSEEKTILGTGGGIKNAEALLGDEIFVVINSDIVCDINLADVIHYHMKCKSDATMVVRHDPQVPNFDEIKLNNDFNVVSINDVPTPPKIYIARMFTGIHILSPVAFQYLKHEFSSVITTFYQPALHEQRYIAAYDFNGFWCDVGTKESLQRINSEDLPFEI
ncbi:nucleotidyltransferase family protein [bacterium]|nr:nucleotidyltransferase family protein [bacterium]